MKKLFVLFFIFFALNIQAVTIYPIPEEQGFFSRAFSAIKECKWHISCYFESRLGVTITTINATDTIKDSRPVINTNFSNLNNGKIENSTSSVAAITTLSNLVSVGTITTGTWSADVIAVNKNGTGTTSPSKYQVLLGNGSSGVTVASSTGSSGQFLTSNGSGVYPSWQTSTVNQGDNYTWTGQHIFTTQNVGIGTTSPVSALAITGTTTTSNLVVASSTITINNLTYKFSSTQPSATSTLLNNGNGGVTWGFMPMATGATTTKSGFTLTQNIPHGLGRTPSMVEINLLTVVDLGGADESCISICTATSTASTFMRSQTRGDTAMTTVSTNSVIAKCDDSGGATSVSVTLATLDATNIGLTWGTNATGGVEDNREVIWKAW